MPKREPRPITVEGRSFWSGWSVALGLGVFLVGFATLPAIVSESAGSAIKLFFASVCHQLPERSPSISGVTLAVCHRCYGIYWGLPIAALVFASVRRRRLAKIGPPAWLLALALVPIAFDWSLDAIGWLPNTPATRMGTGLIFGLGAGWFVVRAAIEAFMGTGNRVRATRESSGGIA